ncbi:hypothetical protein H4Q26_004913 [Puccinia striiformis f. sp. tritici PST-130]|nr:hypothetical protein H4Q26_004913 [Puccinia striiformis f. sp. tritici PST-130]
MNENELPPIEEFDFPAPAEDYWDSDDERELDWIDTLPEDEEDNQPLEKEKKAEKEEDKKGVNSPWHPFRNKNCIKPTISSNAGNENLFIQIPSDIRFHDPNLLALPVDSFDLIYSEIETKNAKTLSNLCGDFMEEFDGAQVEKITLPNPQMSTEGFDAYDVRLEEEVLVMTPVLAFLADSPMHAEITNTPVPSSSLNPCRSCKLSAPSLAEKVTMKYLQEFLQMSSHGTQCLNEHRHWPDMIRDSKKIWEFIKKKKSEKATDKLSIVYGVRDQLNRQFASEIYESKKLRKKLKKKNQPIPEHLQAAIPQHIADMDRNDPESLLSPYLKLEGFDGSRHTPVEILHVFLLGVVKYLFRDFMNHLKPEEKDELVGFWRSFNTESLNIPSVKPMGLVKYASSLVGKDFKVIIQAAPFLFFQFMDAPKRNIWIALCHLAPLWINKPKFHMLLHLPESIRLYGPASLFATEKFESYNGILRNASIHSNRQSPGQDIAITFSSYHSFRQIFSGSMFYDMMKKNLTKPSGPSRYIIHASILKKMEGVNDWYQMAEFTVTEHSLFVNAEEVESCLNLQHNCHDGGCKLTKTRAMRIERNDSDVKALEITHKDDVNFILNSCSLHAIDPHRRTSGLVFRRVEPLQWLDALHEGFNNWKANKKKGKTVIPSVPSISCVDPSFLI